MIAAIRIRGCDDATDFVMQVDKEEAEVVERLARLSQENSKYNCQPTLTVEIREA